MATADLQVGGGTSKAVLQAAEQLRTAFNHLLHGDDVGVSAALTEAQQAALERWQSASGWRAKAHWDLSELDATDQERALVEELRKRVLGSAEAGDGAVLAFLEAECDDSTLLRFLRARDLCLDRAHAMLTHSLEWRRVTRPVEMRHPASFTRPDASDIRMVGFDLHGRPVLYSSFAESLVRTPDDVRVTTICMMEKCRRCLLAHAPSNLIWVCQFGGRHKNGYGLRDANPKFAWTALNLFGNQYPECLHQMLAIDPPSIFMQAWKVIKPVVPQKTAQKGVFLDSRTDNKALFEEKFGADLAQHLFELVAKHA